MSTSVLEKRDPNLTGEERKIDKVREIVAEDKKAFDTWTSDPANSRSLDLTHGAMRYLLIPQRVLEMAENPQAVDVLVLEQSKSYVYAFVVERKQSPVSEEASFKDYIKAVEEGRREARERAKADGKPMGYMRPAYPSNVDLYHGENIELVQQGKLSLNDYVTNKVEMVTVEGEILHVCDYEDREEQRKQGVGTSFLTRLHDTARDMGFKYTTGYHSAHNISFFVGKAGRTPLSEIAPEYRDLVCPHASKVDPSLYTVDFLNPQEREAFLIKKSA
ncbi:MAG: hypothetical protein M1450_01555 [Patescibacteria group bacterium]|nr:hypothetical protein [Patescibacteria group bacterium]